jgi:hypothetical protein
MLPGVVLAIALLGSSGAAHAGIVVDTTPDNGGSHRIGGPSQQAQLMEWFDGSAYGNVRISVQIGSLVGTNGKVDAYLSESPFGPTGGPLVASRLGIAVGQYASVGDFPLVQIFSGVNLKAGISYGVTLFADATGDAVRWATSSSLATDPGVPSVQGLFSDFTTGVNPTEPYHSQFIQGDRFSMLVETVPVSVLPEPMALGLFGLGLAGLGIARRRNGA